MRSVFFFAKTSLLACSGIGRVAVDAAWLTLLHEKWVRLDDWDQANHPSRERGGGVCGRTWIAKCGERGERVGEVLGFMSMLYARWC